MALSALLFIVLCYQIHIHLKMFETLRARYHDMRYRRSNSINRPPPHPDLVPWTSILRTKMYRSRCRPLSCGEEGDSSKSFYHFKMFWLNNLLPPRLIVKHSKMFIMNVIISRYGWIETPTPRLLFELFFSVFLLILFEHFPWCSFKYYLSFLLSVPVLLFELFSHCFFYYCLTFSQCSF